MKERARPSRPREIKARASPNKPSKREQRVILRGDPFTGSENHRSRKKVPRGEGTEGGR